MAERTVKHAFVRYSVKDSRGQVKNTVVVPRGDTHDFPDEVIERYEPLGAFLEDKETLETVGEPRPLDEDASDEDVRAWVAGVSAVELLAFMAENEDNDEVMEKIQAAATSIMDSRRGGPSAEDIPEGLAVTADGLTTRSPATEVDAEGVSGPDDLATGDPADAPHPEDYESPVEAAADNAGMDGSLDHTLEPTDVVQRNARFVTAYISRNPEMASDVLEAEKTLAEEKGREVRSSVVRAVEVSAGHTD